MIFIITSLGKSIEMNKYILRRVPKVKHSLLGGSNLSHEKTVHTIIQTNENDSHEVINLIKMYSIYFDIYMAHQGDIILFY